MDIVIWSAMIIPIVAMIWAFAMPSWRNKFHPWEYALMFFVPLICIVVSYGLTLNSLTNDTEFINEQVISAKHSERWNEYIDKTCYRESCTGSGKDRSCTTYSYDCSYVDDHPEYWSVSMNTGNQERISKEQYQHIVGLWKTENFDRRHSGCYTICGNVYTAKYPHDPDYTKSFSLTHERSYKNKVQASTSVYNFRPIDTGTVKREGLFEYPRAHSSWGRPQLNSFQAILGDQSKWANHKLINANAKYGKQKQLHMMILVFRNKPFDVALTQEAYWKGGNKNEFIVVVGEKDGKISWARVISWTHNIKLKKDIESKVMDMKDYNIIGIVDMMVNNVPHQWVRRQFSEFDALHVDVPTHTTTVVYIVTILVTIGCFVFSMMNGINVDGPQKKHWSADIQSTLRQHELWSRRIRK